MWEVQMLDTKGVVASFATFSARVSKAFFSIHEDDTVVTGGVKVGQTVLRRIVYSVADYWLMAFSAVFIIFMDKQMEYDALGLFLLMWAFDIVVANAFVAIWKRTGEDITLGESYRRAADVIHESHRLAGYLAFLGVILKASFWDGPEHIVIFFHKEIKTEFRMLVVLLLLTAIQAAIWTPIYVLGFETLTELWVYLRQLFF